MLESRSYSVAELEKATGFDRRTIVYYIQFGLLARPGRHGPRTRYPAEAMVRLQFIRGVRDLQARGELLNFTLVDIRRAMEQAGMEQIGRLLEQRMPVAEVAPLLAADGLVPAASIPEKPGTVPPPAAAGPPLAAVPAPSLAAGAPPASPAAPPPQERRAFGLADANVRERFSTAPRAPTPAPVAPPPAAADPIHAGQTPSGAPAPGSATTAPAVPEIADLGRLLRELEIRPAMSGRRLAPGAAEQWTEIPITSRIYLSVRGLGAEDAVLADDVARTLKRVLRAN